MNALADVFAIDHAFALLLLAILPLYARRNFRRLQDDLEAGDRDELLRTYHKTVGRQTALGLALLVGWSLLGRSFDDLGLGAPGGTGFWVGVAIALPLIAYAVLQVWWVTRSERLRTQVRERIEDTGLAALIPLTAAEYRSFFAVAVSAGLWEELLFRGFLIAYFSHWVGIVPAVFAASAAFGFGHLYQGAAGMAKTGFAGLVAGLLYLLTGSLWVPMILHTAVDLHAGTLGYLAFPGAASSSGPEQPAGSA